MQIFNLCYTEKYLEKILSKKKIIQTLTHEIRSPLFNIKSFLETLYEYHFQLTDTQSLEFLEIATQETNRLVRLTNQSLHLSRLNARLPVLFRLLVVEEIISRLAKSYEITVLTKQINFHYKVQINLPRVRGNYDLIFQVLINLIANSVKSTSPKGVLVIKLKSVSSLSINTRRKTFCLRIEVLDTGIGLSKIRKDILCNPYKKVQQFNPHIDGTGIGLVIVKEVLGIHSKGLILISNSNKGADIFFNL
jgi:two-component system sensor histidine kinase NblS